MYPEAQAKQRSAYGNGGAGGAGTIGDNPARTVFNELDHQEKTLQELHGVISHLCERVTLLLSPAPPANQADKNPIAPSTLVIDRLAQNTKSIQAASDRLNEVLGRLHV